MDFFDFLNSAIGSLQSFISRILQFIIALINFLLKVLTFIWQGVVIVASYALNALKAVAGFFKHLWEGFFKNIFTGFIDVIRKVHTWLETHLRPILEWLKKAQKWLERHVWAPLKAYINFLQRIRKWLGILRFLHIKWAEALDRRLAQTEAQLAHAFLVVRGVLNSVISWVNAASDPLRFGRMVMVAVGGRRMAAAMVRMFTGLPIGIFFPHSGKGSHLYENNVVHVNDLNDPRRNPPASDLLLNLFDVPTADFTSADPTPDPAEIDGQETLGYFDDMKAYWFASADLFDGMDSPRISITDTLTENKGQLADAGRVLSDFIKNAVEV